jgi:hypothetical protein
MNNRHTDRRQSCLFDYAFWAMALSYVAVIALVWLVAGATSALLRFAFG